MRQSSEEALQNLVSHITEKRWREVFLLAVGMSPNADQLLLLIKEKIDFLVGDDQRLQEFLLWVKEKSLSLKVSYKLTAVRAFYLDLYLDLDFSLDLSRSLSRSLCRSLDLDLYLDLSLSLSVDLDLYLDLSLSRSLCRSLSLDLNRSLDISLSLDLTLDLDPKLKNLLQKLREQLPSRQDWQESEKWWLANGKAWCEELRLVMIKYCNIGHDWQFSNDQKELLQQYYDGNKLLVDCLNSDCYVSREVRQQIEDTLLLPIADIKQRQQ